MFRNFRNPYGNLGVNQVIAISNNFDQPAHKRDTDQHYTYRNRKFPWQRNMFTNSFYEKKDVSEKEEQPEPDCYKPGQ